MLNFILIYFLRTCCMLCLIFSFSCLTIYANPISKGCCFWVQPWDWKTLSQEQHWHKEKKVEQNLLDYLTPQVGVTEKGREEIVIARLFDAVYQPKWCPSESRGVSNLLCGSLSILECSWHNSLSDKIKSQEGRCKCGDYQEQKG